MADTPEPKAVDVLVIAVHMPTATVGTLAALLVRSDLGNIPVTEAPNYKNKKFGDALKSPHDHYLVLRPFGRTWVPPEEYTHGEYANVHDFPVDPNLESDRHGLVAQVETYIAEHMQN